MFSGRVLDQTMPEDRIHIKARLVKFSWQRGVKIGNIYMLAEAGQTTGPNMYFFLIPWATPGISASINNS